jgi:predicted ferric reductase
MAGGRGVSVAVSGFSTAPLWYTTRSTGVIAYLLLTVAAALGVAATQRAMSSPRWPRFATQDLHRNLSLLGLLFVVVHVATSVLDSFVTISWFAYVVPGVSDYRRFHVALGTVAFDLLLLVIITSLVRTRLPAALWRPVHVTSYAAWPLLFFHFLRTGTDTHRWSWGMWLALFGIAVVGLGGIVRLTNRDVPDGPVRSLRGDLL